MPGIMQCGNGCGEMVEWRLSPTGDREWPFELSTGKRHACPNWNPVQDHPQPIRQQALPTTEREPVSDGLNREIAKLRGAIEELSDEIRALRRSLNST